MERGHPRPAIARVTEAGAARSAHVLARAFAEDPLVRWPIRSDIDPYQGVLTQLEPLARGYALGVLWEDASGAGVAAWLPPGMSDRAEALWEGTKDELSSVFDDDGARYSALWDWMGTHVPEEPVWFLEILGVDPAAQGTASALA